jgi:hypothetical protein
MNNYLDEHDITKAMLNRIREGIDTSNDSIDVQGDELKKEIDLFQDQVSTRVTINIFKLYPNDANAVLSGTFQDGMEFQFSLENIDGLYINVTNLQVTENTLDRLRVLRGYYLNWADRWAKKLATEYTKSSN